MQSWIHVIEWRANTRPELTALVDDRGAAYTYAQLKAAAERRQPGACAGAPLDDVDPALHPASTFRPHRIVAS